MTGDERLREEQIATDELVMSGQDEVLPVVPAPLDDVAPHGVSPRAAFARVVVGLALAGVLVGALWAWLAPSVQGVVALTRDGERIRGFVGDEADHLFTAAFVMLGFLSVLAVVAAALVWKWRTQRGPAMVSALTVGTMLAAGAATGVGALLARWRYGTVDVAGAPVTPEHRVHYVVEAPGVFFGHTPWQIAATIVVPAGVGALCYAIAALASTRDDLGAGPIDPLPTAVFVPPDVPQAPSR